MNSTQKKRMITVIVTVSLISTALILIMYALRQNISLFYTPQQLVAGEAPRNHDIRIGGMVVSGSIKHSAKTLDVTFQITDYKQTVDVMYSGILPDLFRENQGIVALGRALDTTHFAAEQILAKHDENYMPPEVKQALAAKDRT